MSEKADDIKTVCDCIQVHGLAGGLAGERGIKAYNAFTRICVELATLKAQRDGMLAALQMALADHMTEAYLHPLRDGTVEAIRCAIANAEKEERCPTTR